MDPVKRTQEKAQLIDNSSLLPVLPCLQGFSFVLVEYDERGEYRMGVNYFPGCQAMHS